MSLPRVGVEYRWIEALGGRRKTKAAAAPENLGLRNDGFRSYADYMATAPFRQAVRLLMAEGERKLTAYMCSEGLYWRCHRRLVSDYFMANDVVVQHIMPNGELRPHTLTAGAKIADGDVTCPEPEDEGDTLFG